MLREDKGRNGRRKLKAAGEVFAEQDGLHTEGGGKGFPDHFVAFHQEGMMGFPAFFIL